MAYRLPMPNAMFAMEDDPRAPAHLVKRQVLDANCDGVPDGAYGTANITTGAVPGACLRYEITVTNVGTASVTSVVVDDAITTPANGATGTISANVGTLGPGASVVITFGVQIDP